MSCTLTLHEILNSGSGIVPNVEVDPPKVPSWVVVRSGDGGEAFGSQGKPRLTCIPALQHTRKGRTGAGHQMTDVSSATICNP